LREELNHHRILPNPHYLNVGDQTAVSPSGRLIPTSFEARFADPAAHYELVLRELVDAVKVKAVAPSATSRSTSTAP
jgi:hypothetical protein